MRLLLVLRMGNGPLMIEGCYGKLKYLRTIIWGGWR